MKHRTKPKAWDFTTGFAVSRMTEDDLNEALTRDEQNGYIHGFSRAWHYFTNYKAGKRVYDHLHEDL